MSSRDKPCDSKLSEEELIRFIFHETSFDESNDVREHLLRCGHCQERTNSLRETLGKPATLSLTKTIERVISSDEAFSREGLFDSDDDDAGLQSPSDPSVNKRFERRGLLGRGGYGSVYRAFDHKLGREVAVKIPHRSIVGEDGERRRFKREVEATARLRHPYIVALHDFVLTKNDSFLIHELIEGETLEAWIGRQPEGCEPRTAAEIVLRIAKAVSYAYDQRILHRDIKPSNILLELQQADGELPFHPRLADFGVAKIIQNETLTESHHHFVGSIHYAPPEAILHSADAHSHASDIYSLGVVLYELLTGTKAFSGATIGELFRKIGSGEFTSPRQLRRNIPRDLEAICLRCMEMRPDNRYTTAMLLAEDLGSYLSDKPVVARLPGISERAFRLMRRYPTRSAIVSLSLLTLVSFGTLLWLTNRQLSGLNKTLEVRNGQLTTALHSSRQALQHNEQAAYVTNIRDAFASINAGKLRDAKNFLSLYDDDQPLAHHRDIEWNHCQHLISRESQILWKSKKALYCLATFENLIAVAGAEGHVDLIDSASGGLLNRWDTGQGEVNSLVVDHPHAQLICSGDDGTIAAFKIPTGEPTWKCKAFETERAYDLVHSPELKFIYCIGHNGTIAAFDSVSGKVLDSWSSPEPRGTTICFLNEKSIAVGTEKGRLVLIDPITGEVNEEVDLEIEQKIIAITHDPSKNRLVMAVGNTLVTFDLATNQFTDRYETIDTPVAIHLDANSQQFIVAMTGGVIHCYGEGLDGKLQKTDGWVTDGSRPYHVTMPRDSDSSIITLDGSGAVRKWPPRSKSASILHPADGFTTAAVEFLSTNQPHDLPRALISCHEGLFEYDFSTQSSRKIQDGSEGTSSLHLLSPGVAIIGHTDQSASLIRYPTEENGFPEYTVTTLPRHSHPMITASPDGQWIAGCWNKNDHAWIHRFDDFEEVVELPAHNSRAVILAPKTNQIFWNDGLTLCQRPLALQGKIKRLTSFPQVIIYLAISHDEKLMAIGSSMREVYLWDVETNSQRGPALLLQDTVAGIAFTNDERSLMTIDQAGNLCFWNIETGQLTIQVKMESIGGVIHNVSFSKDRRFICLRSDKRSILVRQLY